MSQGINWSASFRLLHLSSADTVHDLPAESLGGKQNKANSLSRKLSHTVLAGNYHTQCPQEAMTHTVLAGNKHWRTS